MSYQMVIECTTYYGIPSHERITFVEKYLRKTLGNINKVRVFESEISHNLIIPQILIYYNDENPTSFIQKVDLVLAGIELTAIRAVVSKVTTRTAEGAILGGAGGGLAASKKKDTLTYILIGTLFGGAIGSLLKDGVPVLAAIKKSGNWFFQKIEPPK